jgi:spermidine synthase
MTPSPEARPNRWLAAYVVLTAIVCGAAIMVIEVLGSRIIGPLFGVSLFVWTAMITVALIALAAGYWAGGVLADRRADARNLYALIAAAGLSVLLVPWIKTPVLELCLPLGLRAGALVSATILFGPSLFLLGCVSPYLVKIAARAFDNIGRTVGGLYALSTFGSVCGTALTGFFLVAYLGVNTAYISVAIALLLLSAGYFAWQRRFAAAVALVAAAFVPQPGESKAALTTNDGVEIQVRYARDTFYGNVKIVDFNSSGGTVREMLIDGLLQGAQDMNNGMSVNRYVYLMQFLPFRLNPGGTEALVIGAGAGFIPRWYSKRGVRTDVVDIDPLIPKLAAEYFGFSTSGDVIIDDARHYLLTTDRRYDFIVLDAYTGDVTPHHLISREMFALIASRLRPNGVLGINLIGSAGADGRMTASVIKTLRTAFDQVDVFPAFGASEGETVGNFEIVAYQGAREPLPMERVPGFVIHGSVKPLVLSYLGTSFQFPERADAIVLSDDYNPMDYFDAPMREVIRGRVIGMTGLELLLR